jgi:uncharacterized membrane protein
MLELRKSLQHPIRPRTDVTLCWILITTAAALSVFTFSVGQLLLFCMIIIVIVIVVRRGGAVGTESLRTGIAQQT